VFGVFAALNAFIVIRNLISEKYISSFPIVGGMAGVAGFLLTPSLRNYAWAPLFLDYGTASVIIAIPKLIRELWQISDFNLVREYIACDDHREIRLRFHKANIFTIRIKIKRQSGELGLVELNIHGEWSQDGEELILKIGDDIAVFDQTEDELRVRKSFDVFERRNETDMEKNKEISLSNVVFTLSRKRGS
jgi:hypothetical protein